MYHNLKIYGLQVLNLTSRADGVWVLMPHEDEWNVGLLYCAGTTL